MINQKQAAVIYYIIFGKEPDTECLNLNTLDSILNTYLRNADYVRLTELADKKTNEVPIRLQQSIWKFADEYGEIFSMLFIFNEKEAETFSKKLDKLEEMLKRVVDISDNNLDNNLFRQQRAGKLAAKLRFLNAIK